MNIQLIACVANVNGKSIISVDNHLFSPKKDFAFFKNITKSVNFGSGIQAVCMGRKTWETLPSPNILNGRLNIVITSNYKKLNERFNGYSKLSKFTNQRQLISVVNSVISNSLNNSGLIFMDIRLLELLIKSDMNMNLYVIGGREIYTYFINNPDQKIRPSRLFITECQNVAINSSDTIAFPVIHNDYKLYSISEKYTENDITFRFLMYRHNANCEGGENSYLNLVKDVLETGIERTDRTGTGTIGVFGRQLRFDISKSVPLMTTKKIAWKSCIEELLWILRGDTDAKILQHKGVKIWDGNSTREFLDARGLQHYPEGVLGPVYGFQLRHFGAKYSTRFSDTSQIDTSLIGGEDQLENIIHTLKTDPFSRRIYISYWNPVDLDKMALPPCHTSIQFYVNEINGQKRLSCHFTMRSNDLGCGFSFNIFFYSVLTYIIAMKCDMMPNELVYSVGDCHIYKDHVEPITKQLKRKPCSEPVLIVDPSVKYKSFSEITIEDFDIIGYNPYPFLRFNMSA